MNRFRTLLLPLAAAIWLIVPTVGSQSGIQPGVATPDSLAQVAVQSHAVLDDLMVDVARAAAGQ